MTDIVKEVQQTADKVYENGKTFLQNIQEGIFIPPKHLKNHAELQAENKVIRADIKALDTKMDKILSKISK